MDFFKETLKGILIGIANAIPGVSGGTMMVSMGIYDKIISSITGLFRQFKKSVLTLLPYVVGMALGIVGLAFCVEYLFGNFPFQTSLLFIGLILGGLPVLFGHLKGKRIGIPHAAVFVLFFAVILLLQMAGEGSTAQAVLNPSIGLCVRLLFIGLLASATMVIPGVSGSMILMLLGYYNPILEAVTAFVKALTAFDTASLLHYTAILMPFGIGVVVGIFAVAKLIEILLKKQEGLTYSAILGLVIASPVAILMQNTLPAISLVIGLTGAAAFAAGFAVAWFLGRE